MKITMEVDIDLEDHFDELLRKLMYSRLMNVSTLVSAIQNHFTENGVKEIIEELQKGII